MERGKHIGARSVLDDTRLLHCLHAAKLQSEQEYKKGSQGVWSQYYLPMDMVNLVHARKAQALASDQDYRKRLHEFTALPEDLKMKWAKRAHMLQSEHRYKSDLNFMKGVGWMALRSPQIESVKKAGELISETKYRQKPESLKFTAVVDSPDLIHAKNSYLQCNERLYKAGDSEARHRYTLPPDHPDFIRARQNALNISDKAYKTSWEQTRASGYDFRIDAIPFQTAKASREIASDYKYREAFLRDRGQMIGFFNANDDAHIGHVLRVGKLQSDNLYRSGYAQNRARFRSHLNQPGFLHAKRSQQLASNINYKQPLHQYTCDPEQLNVKHAKQAYKLQSDVKYKSDLNWLRGIGWTPPVLIKWKGQEELLSWHTFGKWGCRLLLLSMDLKLTKWDQKDLSRSQLILMLRKFCKSREGKCSCTSSKHEHDKTQIDFHLILQNLYSAQQKKYRQHPYALKFTSIKDTPEMIQARISYNQAVDRLYKEHGESVKHQYTLTTDLPEILRAKLNTKNISEIRYKESWQKMKDGGYQLRLDAIPFQAAKASGEIISDHKYKEAFEKMKGQMIGSYGLDGDIRIAHSVHASSLQSNVKYKQGFEDTKTHFHLPLDMINLVHARKAQSLVSEQEYRQLLHQYTSLTDDLRLQCAKNAYKLQSENLYRSDMNFMRGVGCITPGALEIEGKKKASELISESKYRQQPHSFKYTSVTDSPGLLHAKFSNMIANERLYKAAGEDIQHHYTPTLGLPEFTQARINAANLSDVKYRESWHNLRAQGYKLTMEALPFQTARASREIASDVNFTELKQLHNHLKYTEDFEEQRGKGSFPAMITPAYQIAKRANELASDVKYHQMYEKEIKGKASHTAEADVTFTRENVDQYGQDYMNEYEERRGKGSFPAMITPAYQNAKKANELASDIKYKKDLSKMKGAAHFHSLTADDNLVLKQAQSANKLVSEVEYKKDLGNNRGYSINYCDTPQFKNVSKISKYTSDIKYKETYQNQMKGHYMGIGMDKRMLHAMKVGSLASNIAYKSDYKHDGVDYNYPATLTPSYQTTRKLVPLKDVNYRQSIDKMKYSSVASTPQIAQAKINAQQLSDLNYRAQYEKTKTNYTLPQDIPQLVKAKANAELYSEVKYKEGWEKSKGQGFEMKLDSLPLLAAKASRDLASDIKYKEEYEKTKGKATETKDSRLLHSLQVAKMSSEIAYKKDFEESKTHFHLPMDMVNLRHAKKAQALASDLDYRKRLHEYTVVPEDMKTKWAKKAYGLQSDLQYRADLMWMKGVGCITEGSLNIQQAKKAGDLVSEKKYRQKADALKFTSVADSSHIKHAKKSQELQSDVAYRSGKEQFLHQYTITKDDPVFLLAKANAANISEKLYRSSWEKQKEKGFVLRLDALSFLTAKAKRDLASDIKYKEGYEKMKGKLIGVKTVEEDSKMAHSLQMSKLQSDLEYKKAFEDTKNQFQVSLDMANLVHAKKAQNLASDKGYRTALHHYTVLPTDRKVAWAKWAYGLQSDNRYRADLNWMKGAGWIATGSLNVEQAKKAGELISEVRFHDSMQQNLLHNVCKMSV
ncbi:nebulin-related-anchoring protein [Meleagris gallopavo]|uniref:nebulin-related-anchoring protein n=1 Tax=Meleagris gallopavo TaxID=9103 RepID=UPI0012AB5FF0|nr:nebulin-related-anchoring protein [Meleagris gallopavo]